MRDPIDEIEKKVLPFIGGAASVDAAYQFCNENMVGTSIAVLFAVAAIGRQVWRNTHGFTPDAETSTVQPL